MGEGTNHVAVTVVVAPSAQHPQPGHPVTPPHHPSHLAFTGAPLDVLTAAALAALTAGAALLTAVRRRSERSSRRHVTWETP